MYGSAIYTRYRDEYIGRLWFYFLLCCLSCSANWFWLLPWGFIAVNFEWFAQTSSIIILVHSVRIMGIGWCLFDIIRVVIAWIVYKFVPVDEECRMLWPWHIGLCDKITIPKLTARSQRSWRLRAVFFLSWNSNYIIVFCELWTGVSLLFLVNLTCWYNLFKIGVKFEQVYKIPSRDVLLTT